MKRDIEYLNHKFNVSLGEYWFKWLGWVIVLGALRYASQESENTALWAVYYISGFVLVMYFMSFANLIAYRFSMKSSSMWTVSAYLIAAALCWGIAVQGSMMISNALAEIQAAED